MDARLSQAELVDIVNQALTMNCKLPKLLGDDNIERIIQMDAMRFFYRKYKYALMKTYYYVDLLSMYKNLTTDIKFITLPDEIESVRWVYKVNFNEMLNLGYLIPTNSLGFGLTSQPYVASINISEWAESVAVMQGFADALATFSKNTVKNAFDPNSKRFEVQTGLHHNLILEVYAHIPAESLFGDPLFIEYVTGKAYMDLGMYINFTPIQLADNTTVNGQMFYDRGKEMTESVIAQINKISNAMFFFNKTR